jgi:acylphosphatase
MSERIARRLSIHGRVQGVGFRYALMDEASRLGLAGWVRNRRDGTVEAVVSGSAAAVQTLVRWAHRGPPSACVSGVDTEPDAGAYEGFELRPTA